MAPRSPELPAPPLSALPAASSAEPAVIMYDDGHALRLEQLRQLKIELTTNHKMSTCFVVLQHRQETYTKTHEQLLRCAAAHTNHEYIYIYSLQKQPPAPDCHAGGRGGDCSLGFAP